MQLYVSQIAVKDPQCSIISLEFDELWRCPWSWALHHKFHATGGQ